MGKQISQPIFSSESAQQLQVLAEEWHRIINESEEWFARNVNHLFEQCQTMEEWQQVRKAMPMPIDKDGQILDLPGNMHVSLAYAASLVKDREGKSSIGNKNA